MVKRIVRKSPAPEQPVSPYGEDEDPDEYEPSAAADEYEGEEIRGGWGASQETIDSTSNYAQTFRPSKDMQIVKFLEAKPYAAFRRHWIDRVGVGKRAYTCLRSIGRECPICDVGDKPGAVTAFNIAVLSDDEPVLKSWECAVKLTGVIKTYANEPKIGPLNRDNLYFSVIKSDTQQRQQSQTNVNPVRGRDIEEDYPGLKPLTEAQIAKLLDRVYKADIVEVPNMNTMEAVAAEFAGAEGESEEDQRGWGS